MTRRLVPGLVLASLSLVAPLAQSGIPGLVWDLPEIVDQPVLAVPAPVAPSSTFWEGAWWVVYEKSNCIYVRSRDETGWTPPNALSDGSAAVENPHIAGGDQLHIVWEDDRTGHTEVWTRRWDGVVWSSAECLSCDGICSRLPAIAASSGGAGAVWQDSTEGSVGVVGRFFRGGTWEGAVDVSESPAEAREPSIASSGVGWPDYSIVWSDSRHGDTEIYLREGSPGSFGDGRRITDLEGACRSPSARLGLCEHEEVLPPVREGVVSFEVQSADGQTQLYVARGQGWDFDWWSWYSVPINSPGETPTGGAGAGGFPYSGHTCHYGNSYEETFVAWTTREEEPCRSHLISSFGGLCTYSAEGKDTLTTCGLSQCQVAARPGEPDAEILALWIERIAGSPTLLARRGHMPGCYLSTLEPAPVLILAPGGVPPTTARFYDRCGGSPIVDYPITIYFSEELEEALIWDPEQAHPQLIQSTGPDGVAVFRIRGGGCSQAGGATAACYMFMRDTWAGAKSPDVNGDCAVRDDDVAYVRSRLGTDDFCADLDGSGTVDAADVAVVESVLGDACSDIIGADEIGVAGHRADGMKAQPNPAPGWVLLRGEWDPAIEWIAIYDAGGRIVRRLTIQGDKAGEVFWNGLDESGVAVVPGVYFARPEGERRRFDCRFVMVR